MQKSTGGEYHEPLKRPQPGSRRSGPVADVIGGNRADPGFPEKFPARSLPKPASPNSETYPLSGLAPAGTPMS